MSAELAFADVHVAQRASGPSLFFACRNRIRSLQLDFATEVRFVHRHAAGDCYQCKRKDQFGDTDPFISENEPIHDKFSCGETEAFVHGRYHATTPRAAESTIFHAFHQEQ